MNLIPSIHDTKEDAIAKICQQSTTEQSHDINLELYSAGWFDGLTGLDAELPHFYDYWDVYQLGYREYCCGLLGVEIFEREI